MSEFKRPSVGNAVPGSVETDEASPDVSDPEAADPNVSDPGAAEPGDSSSDSVINLLSDPAVYSVPVNPSVLSPTGAAGWSVISPMCSVPPGISPRYKSKEV